MLPTVLPLLSREKDLMTSVRTRKKLKKKAEDKGYELEKPLY
jgi:hypothetical protein